MNVKNLVQESHIAVKMLLREEVTEVQKSEVQSKWEKKGSGDTSVLEVVIKKEKKNQEIFK